MPPSFNQPTDSQNADGAQPQFTPPVSTTPPPYTQPLAAPLASAARTVDSDPRNLLAALLLTLAFGITGLHQLYLGREKQAWIRFGLLFAFLPVSVLMFISPSMVIVAGILALIVLPALFIWGVVDIFKVYQGRMDGDGNALHAGPRDAKAAKIVFWATILINAVIPILMIITTFTSISSYNSVQERARESMDRQNSINDRRLRQSNELYQ